MHLEARAEQQATMDLEEQVDRDDVAFADAPDRVEHGVDVAEHVGRGHVASRFAQLALSVGVEQAPGADLESLDA